MTSRASLAQPLTLPCGATLANRIGRAAMTEGLADPHDDANERHNRLYRTWSHSGAGLHITGNVMLDRRYLERPGNVVLDDETDLDALAAWGSAGTEAGNHLWMQLSHPGRQTQKTTATQPVAPSAVGLKMGGLFGRPRALATSEIRAIIASYATAAIRAREAGFTGVQIHSAHGYLSSQFLSPRVNRRTDEWGGPLENRARYLLEAVRTTRDAVGEDFPVAVKLNSSDFQKGGFSNEDAATVAGWLQAEGIDLLEISGGTYESLAFVKQPLAEGTRRREAYFLEYAKLIREAAPDVPLMVTGGFRTAAGMSDAIESGALDLVGIARPFCVEPAFPQRLLAGEIDELPTPEHGLFLGSGRLGPRSPSAFVRVLNAQATTSWFYQQILHIADDEPIELDLSGRASLARHVARDTKLALARKRRGRSSRP